MSSPATATVKIKRGPKTRGTEWWEPPADTPLNLGIPYVVSSVDDGLSLAQSRVFACITNLKDGAKREAQATGGRKEPRLLCQPGGYTRIAKKTGLCRKTAYNAVQALIAKRVLSVWKREMKGRQVLKTYYFALHYADILPIWRSNEDFADISAGRNVDGTWKKTMKLFHTSYKSSIVVRKRSKQFVGVDEAAEWKINPDRAPKKGSGRGLQELREAVEPREMSSGDIPTSGAPAPPEVNDEDLMAVHLELLRQTGASCLKDAIDLIASARAEAKKMGYEQQGYGGPLPCLTIAELIRAAGERYVPKVTRLDSLTSRTEHPRPTPGWFLGGQLAREVARHLHYDWEQKQG